MQAMAGVGERETPGLECVVPIRLRLVGTPTAEDLVRVEAAVARLVARRVEQAEHLLAGSRPAAAWDEPVRDVAPSLDADRTGSYRIMSYQGPPHPVRVPVTRPGSGSTAQATRGSVAPAVGPAAAQAALQRITKLLSTGIFDWAVTDAEAREALRILLRLAPKDLFLVVGEMRRRSLWATLGRELPRDADNELIELQERMDPNAGYLMPGDTLRVEVLLGGNLQQDVSGDYVLDGGRLAMRQLDEQLDVAGLLPAQLPDRIARAYIDGLIFADPWVRVAVKARGAAYVPHSGPTRGLLWFEGRMKRSRADQAQLDKRRELLSYIAAVRPDTDLIWRALDRYYTWVEKHYGKPEFLHQDGPALWAASLQGASAPVPVSPRGPFLQFATVMLRAAAVAPPDERDRMMAALGDYQNWLDSQPDDALGRYIPAQIWSRIYVRHVKAGVQQAVAAKMQREREAAAEAAANVDLEAAGRKLDEALELLKRNVWRVREPYTIEDHERGVGYLVWESSQEIAARDLIARGFLHDLIASIHRPGFASTSVKDDFRRWLSEHPAEYETYLVAQAHPDVEKYEVPIDIPGWQTAIETSIGFIPIVGSIVAAGEATFGYDLFGHELSTADRAILAASVLLPAAGKAFRAGRAAVTVRTLARDYRLSASEAKAAYRALTQVQPGTAGARLLESAARDVKAGRPVRDAERLTKLEKLFTDMGLTDRATAKDLRAGAAEAALEGRAGRTGQEAADIFATEEEIGETLGREETSTPGVTGGKRPRIDDVSVPTEQRVKLDIEYLPRAAGESQRAALARVRRVIGRRMDTTPLGPFWERARAKVVGGRSLAGATRQEMFDLYNKVRNEFWDMARADPDAVRYLDEAGFEFAATGKAPLVKVTDPPAGLRGWPKAADIPIQERRVSLDHNLEKALGENYRRAIDADNLTFEFHNPNSNRETVQRKFGLRPTPGDTD
jgi:Pre-toxin TG